jgi:protein-disulfide isomerase
MSLRIPVSEKYHVQGHPHAPVTLVEYGDYECPHCGHAYPIVKRLQQHFPEEMRFVFRNFPLTESHPHAMDAALFAEAMGKQHHFWKMHDLIYENQERLSPRFLLELAEKAGGDIIRLSEDVASDEIQGKVEEDFEGGIRSGVNGTPTFFINGSRYNGNPSFEDLAAAIQHAATVNA